MAIYDKENMFSEDQAVTTTAVSTNVIDLGPVVNLPNTDTQEPLRVPVKVTEAFAGGTSVKVTVQSDTTAAFSSATDLVSSEAIATASLEEGYEFALNFIPKKDERYVRLNYTVVGTHTAGKLHAGIQNVNK